jgi:hypothetical protein
MPAWVARTILSGSSVDPNATNQHTCSFTPATSGNLLVAIVAGAMTSSTPVGWNLAVSSVLHAALYVFTKTATAGEASFVTTHNSSDYALRGIVYEFPAGTSLIGSNSQLVGVGGATTGPTMSELSTPYSVLAARSHGLSLSAGVMSVQWTAPGDKDYEAYVGRGANDGIGLSVAVEDGVTADTFTCSYSSMYENTANEYGESVVFALSGLPTRSGKIKHWNGTQWQAHPLKEWNGTTWVTRKARGHTGTEFIESK